MMPVPLTRRRRGLAALASVAMMSVGLATAAAPSTADPVEGTECHDTVMQRSITYIGVTKDRTDLAAAGLGRAGFWFPQFAAGAPVADRPTGENARDALPPWAGPLSNFPEDPDFAARTFSQDGPARSEGGQPAWNTLTLPDGTTGLSGAIVDPATAGNTNNTINRIQLAGEVPASFYLSVVTDNTNREHDPTGIVRARGNAGPTDSDDAQVEADTYPQGSDLSFNGTADVYTFRYDGFVSGDYLKLRLSGDPAPATGASFGGLLLDVTFAGDPAPPAPSCVATPGPPDGPALPTGPPAPPAPGPMALAPAPEPTAPDFPPAAEPARPVAAQPDFTG